MTPGERYMWAIIAVMALFMLGISVCWGWAPS
jgi:hypothetical protein